MIEFTRTWSNNQVEKWKPKVESALEEFPEFSDRRIVVGRTGQRKKSYSEPPNKIWINPDRAKGLYSIGRELMRVLSNESDIPSDGAGVDIWTIARSEKFLDEPPAYLCLRLFADWCISSRHYNADLYARFVLESEQEAGLYFRQFWMNYEQPLTGSFREACREVVERRNDEIQNYREGLEGRALHFLYAMLKYREQNNE